MKKSMLCVSVAAAISVLLSACGGGMSSAPEASGSHSTSEAVSNEAPAAYESYASTESADGFAPPNGYTEDASQGETYLTIDENLARLTEHASTLTFSLKVDTAAYTNVSRYLESGNLPPHDAVRTEEMINYFRYDNDMTFSGAHPFAVSAEVGPSPFHEKRYMAFIRVKSKDIDRSQLPPSNLTFLIDTSGSMNSYDKLPLLKEAFGLLVETLEEDDRVSIVTYAGSSAVILDGASGADKQRILNAVNNLEASGSTAGANGIMTAYALTEKNFLENGNNRVLLATDGDFNVGVANPDELAQLVGEKRGNNVYMSILGFGTGNIGDDIMETLSREGNGNYSYINDLDSAKKVLVEELAANLFTIADDVKAQVEFNPQNVKSYRLIGYENRRLNNEDFEDDTKDAGEIGAGTDVVMMFELELHGGIGSGGSKYSAAETVTPDFADELFEVRLRYKNPGEPASNLMTQPVYFDNIVKTGSADYQFACAVAAFGHLLRESDYSADVNIGDVRALAEDGRGRDEAGYRGEFLALLDRYEQLTR